MEEFNFLYRNMLFYIVMLIASKPNSYQYIFRSINLLKY